MDFSIGTSTYPYSNAYNNYSPSVGSVGGAEAVNPANPEEAKKIGATGGPKGATECQTCKNRKYQDGSDEMVSFKSAAHISPEAAGTAVRAHEQEHVANAYKKAEQSKGGAKVLQASVTLKTAICPECGRAYIAGGVTNTKIAYSNEEQPYQKNLKAFQEEATKGNNVDIKG